MERVIVCVYKCEYIRSCPDSLSGKTHISVEERRLTPFVYIRRLVIDKLINNYYNDK